MKKIPCLIVLCGVVFGQWLRAAETAGPGKPTPGKLASTIFDWKDLKAEERSNGIRRAVFNSATSTLGNFECHITTLNPGADSGAPHAHTGEEAIFVQSGIVEVTINDTKKTVGPGSVLYYAGKDLTATRNPGPGLVTYVVFSIHVTAAPPAP